MSIYRNVLILCSKMRTSRELIPGRLRIRTLPGAHRRRAALRLGGKHLRSAGDGQQKQPPEPRPDHGRQREVLPVSCPPFLLIVEVRTVNRVLPSGWWRWQHATRRTLLRLRPKAARYCPDQRRSVRVCCCDSGGLSSRSTCGVSAAASP